MFKASQILNYNEFRVYMYIVTNKDGYDFKLSTKHISDETNTSQRNIQRTVNGLVDKGYIIQNEDTTYSFLEDTELFLNDRIEQNNATGFADETTGFTSKATESAYESDKNSTKTRQIKGF